MILQGLTWLVLLQLLGNLINLVLLPALPGPIIGMLLLFGLLLLRRSIPESLEDRGLAAAVSAAAADRAGRRHHDQRWRTAG